MAKPKRTVANRAARTVQGLRNTLKNWYSFYNGYDPLFTWWNAEPYKAVDTALEKYSIFILDKLVGIKPDDKTTIIGDPIGREALLDELHHEMIPYTPGATGRDRQQGICVVRGRDEKGFARYGLWRRLEKSARERSSKNMSSPANSPS